MVQGVMDHMDDMYTWKETIYGKRSVVNCKQA